MLNEVLNVLSAAIDIESVFLVVLFVVLFALFVGAGFSYWSDRRARDNKDKAAQVIAERLDHPFFLYLRSFRSDQPTTERWTITENGRRSGRAGATPKAMLEYLLQDAGQLIEVGGNHPLGLGRVRVSDAEWWERAVSLIIHSTAVFITPDLSASLTREIAFICSDKRLLRRAFLVMEPVHETMLSAAFENDLQAARQRQDRWNETKVSFQRHGIMVPDYDARGSIISLDNPGLQVTFSGLKSHTLFRLLEEMSVDLTKLGSYNIEPSELCPCGSQLCFAACHWKRLNPPLEHDPEKCAAVFPPARSPSTILSCGSMLRRAKAGRKRSCSTNNLERDDDSKKSHHALGLADRPALLPSVLAVSSRASRLTQAGLHALSAPFSRWRTKGQE
jgi:hypothetical protein